MQFGFCPGHATTDAIFILRQLPEKYLTKHRKLYIWHLSIRKRPLIYCLKRNCGGLFILLVYWNGLLNKWKLLHVGARSRICVSRICVNSSFSEQFEVKVGKHQGSKLSALQFIIFLEALSHKFCVGCP